MFVHTCLSAQRKTNRDNCIIKHSNIFHIHYLHPCTWIQLISAAELVWSDLLWQMGHNICQSELQVLTYIHFLEICPNRKCYSLNFIPDPKKSNNLKVLSSFRLLLSVLKKKRWIHGTGVHTSSINRFLNNILSSFFRVPKDALAFLALMESQVLQEPCWCYQYGFLTH